MANPPVKAESTDASVPAIEGKNVGGFAIMGTCDTGHGVHGESVSSRGVVGRSQKFHGVYGKSAENVGVAGESDGMNGVLGISHIATGAGVAGSNDKGGDGVVGTGRRGVVGISETYQGVFGRSIENAGVVGESDQLHGVFGICHNPKGAGVFGTNTKVGGSGLQGISESGDGVIGKGKRGVVGESQSFQGVYGRSNSNAGVVGESESGDGVFGISHKATAAGVSGHNTAAGIAGFFEGNVVVTGVIHMARADYAEDFTVADPEQIEAGMVVILGELGSVRRSEEAYDRRVAGVVSGAGGYQPAVVLDHDPSLPHRRPIALMGKVYCWVDATAVPVATGDLLTTSSVPGHAMKAVDPVRAFGSVVGKALQPLSAGHALLPILVRVQ